MSRTARASITLLDVKDGTSTFTSLIFRNHPKGESLPEDAYPEGGSFRLNENLEPVEIIPQGWSTSPVAVEGQVTWVSRRTYYQLGSSTSDWSHSNWSTPTEFLISGAAGKTVKLIPTSQVIRYNESGVETDSISFTFQTSGVSNTATYKFYIDGDLEATTSNPEYSFTLPDNEEPGAEETKVVALRVFEGEEEVAIDSVTVFGLKNGTDGTDGLNTITVFLTNENHTVPANSDGTTTTAERQKASGSVKIFFGTEDITSYTGSLPSTPDVNGITFINGSSTPGFDITIAANGGYTTTNLQDSVDSGVADIVTTIPGSLMNHLEGFDPLNGPYDTLNITKTFTISKSKAGISPDALTVDIDTSNENEITFNFSDESSATVSLKSVVPIYADDALGTNRSYTQGDRVYVNYYEYEGPKPPENTLNTIQDLTFVKFKGEDGDLQGVIPIYATSEEGANPSLVYTNQRYVNFYEWTQNPPVESELETLIDNANPSLVFVLFVGDSGDDGRTVKLIPSSQVIRYDESGNENDSISFTAETYGFEETITYKYYIDGSLIPTGSGAAFTLPDNLEPSQDQKATIKVEAYEGSPPVLKASDAVTIYGIKNGTDGTDGISALTGFLTNESHTVASTPVDGGQYVPTSSLSDAGGTFKVFYGTQEITNEPGVTFSKTNSSQGLAIEINSTSGVYTISNFYNNYTTATATFRATVSGALLDTLTQTAGNSDVTLEKIYTIAKSAGGVEGPPGSNGAKTASGILYYQLAVPVGQVPSTPSASSFNFNTFSFSGLSANWSLNAPTVEASPDYVYYYSRYTLTEGRDSSGNPTGSTSGTEGSLSFTTPETTIVFNGLVTFTGSTLKWDNNSFNYTAIDGANITTGSIDAQRLTIGDPTSPTQNKLKLYDDCLKIFNSGQVRVKLGNLSNTTDEQ